MPLTLRAISLNDHPLTQPMAARFEAEGGSIGRADHNTLALPDPERHISRQQAEIRADGDGYRIRNVGSANPIMVRGQALARGDSVPLGHGDQVRIGAYLLDVLEDDAPGGARASGARPLNAARLPITPNAASGAKPASPSRTFDGSSTGSSSAGSNGGAAPLGRQVAPAEPASPLDAFADLGGALPSSNPFADLLAPPPPPPHSPQPHQPPDSARPMPLPSSAPRAPRSEAAMDVEPSARAAAGSTRPGFIFDAQVSAASDFDASAPPSPPSSTAPGRSPSPPVPSSRSLSTSPPAPTEAPLLDPFAELLPAASGIAASSAAWAPPPSPPRAFLPDDFDPFALPPSRQSTPFPGAAPAAAADAFEGLIPSADTASIDDMFGLQSGGSDPLAGFMAASMPGDRPDRGETPSTRRSSTDPMVLLFDEPSSTSPAPARGDAGPSRADDVPELRAAFVPPGPAGSSRTSSSSSTARSPAAAAAGAAAAQARPRPSAPPYSPPLSAGDTPDCRSADFGSAKAPAADPGSPWAAFCLGAGLNADLLPPGTDPQQSLQLAGQLLRAAVDGAVQLMMVRATTKHELGAEVTVIRARNNNPLKFSPDATSALEQLLKPPLRGFLPGPAAMTDAMHDLVGHAIGTMAGTRAALEGVLDRFAPQQLEAQLTSRSVLDSVLPMNRKAKLWELYLHHFDALRDEAQENFHALFGRAFLTAYEEQLDRLSQAEKDRSPPGL